MRRGPSRSHGAVGPRGVVALLLGVLAVQLWVTLRAPAVLVVEGGVVLLVLAGWALLAWARHRRRTQHAADRGRAEVRGTAAPQGAPVAMPLVPSVTFGTDTAPVPTLVDDRPTRAPDAPGPA